MMRKVYLIAFFSLLLNTAAADKLEARMYFTKTFGHVHQHPLDNSNSLTILQCAHFLEVLDKEKLDADWAYVKVGEDKGYIRKDFLSDKKPNCWQEKYPRFFQSLNLDLTQMYFWGRLSDHYIEGKSSLK